MFKKFKWIFHPISLFITAQICLFLLMFTWIRWYLLRSQEIKDLLEHIPFASQPSGQWVILVQGCILMGFLLLAIYLIFVSQRRLVKITKMQDTILSSVTHELKTPLASIQLYTETMLMREVKPTDQKKFLKKTLLEAQRLQALIQSILLSARLDFDATKKSFSKLDFREVLENCYQQLLERFSDTRQLSLDIDFQGPCFLWGEREHLEMLLSNLFTNAHKYTENQGKIAVKLVKKKDTCVLTVEDDGIGIEKKYLKKIFRKFYRVAKTSQIKVAGSGLGLSVCRSIVQQHGGHITAVSEGHGQGSRFVVNLPRDEN